MCPYKGIPDCFNCSLPDCKADSHELNHQEHLIKRKQREKREESIKQDFRNGLRVFELADKYKVSDSRITQILRERGVNVRLEKKIRYGGVR